MDNKMLLSICIPTLNRPDLLIGAIKSIINNIDFDYSNIEICISNNKSEISYLEVDDLINSYKNIKYICQDKRISLDENMHACINMASSTYIYLLGDDDYFMIDGLKEAVSFIQNNDYDLVIINGLLNNEKNQVIGRLFPGGAHNYDNFLEAFSVHNSHCMFGAIIVRRSYIDNNNFRLFYGTSHAYMSFWLTMSKRDQSQDLNFKLKIGTPIHPIVFLRTSNKSYSDDFIEILYSHMPKWYQIFINNVNNEEHAKLAVKIAANNFKYLLSWRFLIGQRVAGHKILPILKYNLEYRKISIFFRLYTVDHIPIQALTFFLKVRKWLLSK